MAPTRVQLAWLAFAALAAGLLATVSEPVGVMAMALLGAAVLTAMLGGLLHPAAGALSGWLAGGLVRLAVAFGLAAAYRDEPVAIVALPFLYLASCLVAAVWTPAPTATHPPTAASAA